MNTRIRYHEVGAGVLHSEDSTSQLQAAYVAIIGDVRILAAQRKKVPRKRIVTAAYSVENDLDVYKLSAQLAVISKDNIKSIGDWQGRIAKLRQEYEKQRQEINGQIEEHNRLVSLWEQVQLFDELSAKNKLSDAEQLQISIHSKADIDHLRNQAYRLQAKINTLKGTLDKTRQRYDVYCDIYKTYREISKGDYISNLVEEERKRQEQVKKKNKRR